MHHNSPIAMVGMSCLFPGSADAKSYWANIRQGIDGISDIPKTHWRPEDYFSNNPKTPDHTYAKRGGFIPVVEFDPLEFGILPNALEATDTSQLLGMYVAAQALRDAGYGEDHDFNREMVSVILGITGALELVVSLGARLGHPHWKKALREAGVDDVTAADVVNRIGDAYPEWQESSFPGLLGNVVAGRISKHLNLGGTNCVVDAACASSLSAMEMAILELQTGKSNMVVCGGADTFNDIFMYMCFSKTPALSPTGEVRPFDQKGDGTMLGEGLGIVVLKRLEDAKKDNDKIYAVIRGLGSSSDGKGGAVYEPNGAGQQKALQRAYTQAGVKPQDIDLIEAHGTGTRVGDAVELSALHAVYGEATKPWCALGSVKSQIGHTKAAAGVAGVIKAALALYFRTLPPSIKTRTPLEALQSNQTPFYLNRKMRPWLTSKTRPRLSAVSAFGFGGSNFHMVLEEYKPQQPNVDWDETIEILAISAENSVQLEEKVQSLLACQHWFDIVTLLRTWRAEFDVTHACRLGGVMKRQEDIAVHVGHVLQALKMQKPLPNGFYFSDQPCAGALALLFPGQGSQYVNMMLDMACRFPEAFDVLAEMDQQADTRISEKVYPVDHEEDPKQQAKQLRQTDVVQPALGAVSAALFAILKQFGLQPDVMAGHSYGELVALHAAGCLSQEDFCYLSVLRGQLMGAVKQEGAMLAVQTTQTRLQSLLVQHNLNLVIANRNAPEQMILSGERVEIEKAVTLCAQAGLRTVMLPVSAAFHSPMMSGVADDFAEALDQTVLQDAVCPVYANIHGECYPQDGSGIRNILAKQLSSPVKFMQQVQRMYADGVRTFIEVGSKQVLSTLVQQTLGDNVTCYAMDQGAAHDAMSSLASLLVQLSVAGHAVDLQGWNAGVMLSPVSKKRMCVAINGANYLAKRPQRPAIEKKEAVKKIKPEQPRLKENKPEIRKKTVAKKPTAVSSEVMMQALQNTQESIGALQRMQEHTAHLHQQFMQNQQLASQQLQQLLQQQSAMLHGQALPDLTMTSLHAPSLPAVQPMATPSAPSIQTPMVQNTPQPVAPPVPPVPQVPEPPVIPTPNSTVVNPVVTAASVVHPQISTVTPVATSNTATASIETVLLQTISEKTGYPVDMLEMDMSLDADLGIDSIKRVEILSALQEALPKSPMIEASHLGTLHSLADIAGHLAGDAVTEDVTTETIQSASSESMISGDSHIETVLLQTISDKTGYPVDMLEMDMSLDADLGIDSIKRVEILSALQEALPQSPVIEASHLGTLHSLADIAAHLQGDIQKKN